MQFGSKLLVSLFRAFVSNARKQHISRLVDQTCSISHILLFLLSTPLRTFLTIPRPSIFELSFLFPESGYSTCDYPALWREKSSEWYEYCGHLYQSLCNSFGVYDEWCNLRLLTEYYDWFKNHSNCSTGGLHCRTNSAVPSRIISNSSIVENRCRKDKIFAAFVAPRCHQQWIRICCWPIYQWTPYEGLADTLRVGNVDRSRLNYSSAMCYYYFLNYLSFTRMWLFYLNSTQSVWKNR